ncbi:hypothetical protein CcaCcLH18_12284 [Colletotrichum camelliae]|nr:hypothetical protein CcaCcLH18_12284 [Colletotrichum camelliae]
MNVGCRPPGRNPHGSVARNPDITVEGICLDIRVCIRDANEQEIEVLGLNAIKQQTEPLHPADEFSTLTLELRPDPDAADPQTLHLCLHAGRPHRSVLAIHLDRDGSIYVTDAPYPGIPRRPYGNVRLTDVVNLYALDDIDDVDEHLPKSSSPRRPRDTLYLNEDDKADVDLALAPYKRPALPPLLPAKPGQPWLCYMVLLALLAALLFLSVWVLLSVFQRPLVLAIPVHRPINNLLEAYNPLDLMLFSEIKRDLQPEREQHSLALVRRLTQITESVCGPFLHTADAAVKVDINIDVDIDAIPPPHVCALVLDRLAEAVNLLIDINAKVSTTATHVYFLGQWLAEGTLHLDAEPASHHPPLTPSVARLFLYYLSPELPLSAANAKPHPIDGRLELLRYITQLPLLLAKVGPLLGPVKFDFETHILPSLPDSEPTRADLISLGEMTKSSQVLSLRMTSALQRVEDLRVALGAVNAFSPKSPELADGGGEKETAPLWNSSTLDGWTGSHEELALRLYDITFACISAPYQFEDADEGEASTSAPLLPPPTEHHGRPRMPATLVASQWHKWFPASAITTLEPDVVAIHQAVDRMGSQLKRYSHLQVEEIRRRDLAEEQKRSNQAAYLGSVYAAFDHLVEGEAKASARADARDSGSPDSPWIYNIYQLIPFFSRNPTAPRRQQSQPEPVGVRVPAHPEVAREASVDEFVAWYGPVWLSLSAHSRQLIRERDVDIATLEYLLHEREWQLYRNKIKENRNNRRWGSTPPSGNEGTA